MGVLQEQGICDPRMETALVCLFLSSSKVSASLSCPVVEATSEGMVGILRLGHS